MNQLELGDMLLIRLRLEGQGMEKSCEVLSPQLPASMSLKLGVGQLDTVALAISRPKQSQLITQK